MELIKKEEKKTASPLSEEELEKRLLNWPDAYYKESDPGIRLQMLERASEKEMTPEDNEIRRKFFYKRYPNFGTEKMPELDLYLRAWMAFRFAAENSGPFAVRKRRRELTDALEKMGYFDAETEQEKRLMYQEVHQLGLLYIQLCLKDRGYNSVLLGFGRLSDEKLARKIGDEFREASETAPEKVGMTEECEIWSRALQDAYTETFLA